MPMVISFADAINETQGIKRHVLLANGYSIACRPDIFQYGKLFEQAEFRGLPRAQIAFGALGTTDFERVIRALKDFASLAAVYYPNDEAGRQAAAADADALREVLVQTIADSHPARPGDITVAEYTRAKAFLDNFDRIFTINYDLLLYWTLMQDEIEPEVRCDDGFRKPEDDHDADYVTWEPENAYEQNVYYLHGALHIFDSGVELQKFTWTNTRVPLIDQIRAALGDSKYPVFVSEGTSDEKFTRIRHNDYLAKAYRSFTAIGGSLFVFGHGMAENDEHILRAIEHNKIERLYVSLFGPADSETNKFIIRRASALARKKSERRKMEVKFYDAASAAVWRA